MDLRKAEAKMDAEGIEMNVGTRVANRASNTEVIKEAAKRNPGTKQSKNTRPYREAEKNKVQAEQSAAVKFGLDEKAYLIETPEETPVKHLPDELWIRETDSEEERERKYEEMIKRLVKLGTQYSR